MEKLKEEFLNLNPVMKQYSPSTLETQWQWITQNFTAKNSIRVENRVMPNEVLAGGLLQEIQREWLNEKHEWDSWNIKTKHIEENDKKYEDAMVLIKKIISDLDKLSKREA